LPKDAAITEGAGVPVGAGTFQNLLLYLALYADPHRTGVTVLKLGRGARGAHARRTGVSFGAGVGISRTLRSVWEAGLLADTGLRYTLGAVDSAAIALVADQGDLPATIQARDRAVKAFAGYAGRVGLTAIVGRAGRAYFEGIAGDGPLLGAGAQPTGLSLRDGLTRDTVLLRHGVR